MNKMKRRYDVLLDLNEMQYWYLENRLLSLARMYQRILRQLQLRKQAITQQNAYRKSDEMKQLQLLKRRDG